MPSNRNTPLPPSFSIEETQALLASFDSLPVRYLNAGRIRRRVLREAAPKRVRRRAASRVLLPLAACLAAILLLFACFPQAAQAVASFFGLSYTPSRYMSTLPESRTPLPSVDEALEAAAPKDGDYYVTLLPDLPRAAELAAYRESAGLKPFSEDDWGWLRDIRPEIAEVLYDGKTLIWNTNLYMTNDHVQSFMKLNGADVDVDQCADALMEDVTYTVEGDPTVYTLNVSGHGITPIFDDSVYTADHVVLYSDFDIDPEQPLPDGVITITQNIRVAENDALGFGETVAIITHTFAFDTTKGNTQSAASNEQIVPLSGETYLSVFDYDMDPEAEFAGTVATKKVSLDGVKLRVLTEYLPTGIRVTITPAEIPADWQPNMSVALLSMTDRTTSNEVLSPGVLAELSINGESGGEASRPDSWGENELVYILPVFPDSYSVKRDITLDLTYAYYETLNGTDQLGGEVFSIEKGTCNMEGTCGMTPLARLTIPVP